MALTLGGTSGIVGAGITTLDASGLSVTGVVTTTALDSSSVQKFTINGNEKVRIISDGKVGINTITPATLLQVVGSTGSTGSSGGTLGVRQKGDTSNDGITLTSSHANSARFYKDSDGALHIYNTGGTDKQFVLRNDGKLGIGTTNPSTTVDAIGTVRATSFTATQPEYLRVAHTDASHNQSLTDNTTHWIQFGSSYNDTKSGWTSGASNYYTIQETGYFLITSQAVINSNTSNSLREWVLGVEQSTDSGSSWSVLLVNGGRGGGTDSTDTDTITPSLTLMHYLAAGTRIRVRAYGNTDGGTWQVDEDLSDPLSGTYGGGVSDNQKGTRLFIMRLF